MACESCADYMDNEHQHPEPGWCMSASEEMASRAERGMEIPGALRDALAEELGF